MRPLRLLLDGFGSYRHETEIDFSGVEFFALTGPTGAGKSTVIDGLCFALYGTVPRWGKENVIAHALAPSASACRVCLVFEAAGKRYAAVRALTRGRGGQVQTREARLELLDPGVPADAPLAKVIESAAAHLAEGPDQVKASVQEILGLSYEHFTQAVLLPQGRFSEFLRAKASERQHLLVQLLAFGVYEQVGQKARLRARLAAGRAQQADMAQRDFAEATEAAEQDAAARARALATLAATAETKLEELMTLRAEAERAETLARAARDEVSLLAAVRAPADVPGLAGRIAQADQRIAESVKLREAAEAEEARAEERRAALGDRSQLEAAGRAHTEHRELTAVAARQHQQQADSQAEQDAAEAGLAAARERFELAQAAHEDAKRAHAAAALAQGLHDGDECPVCLRPIPVLPQRAAPPQLATAQAAVKDAQASARSAEGRRDRAVRAASAAASAAAATAQRLATLGQDLAGAASEADITAALREITAADQALTVARGQVREQRRAESAARQARDSLADEEQQAQAKLAKIRDSVVTFGAPALAGDLAAAWDTITAWAGAGHRQRVARQPALDQAAMDAGQRAKAEARTLAALLAEHGITGVTDAARIPAVIAKEQERARNDHERIRADRAKAAKLADQAAAHREEEQVAAMLGQRLQANTFERWLCGEALDALVTEASQTLMELSGERYQLGRDERNELVVIDYADAGARRPVHTLSGGETFQASLALALALSRQVVGLSAGQRDLNSMFLDEGFGTLDEDTLETVAATLERLALSSDRMVGIITHVPALADRVPVRFEVSRSGGVSTLRKVRAG